jgi:hypothetical protein
MSHEHDIEFPESFHIRKPVLSATLPADRWAISPDGSMISFDISLAGYSSHERDVIEFALNPYITSANIFSGLGQNASQALATALHELFGPGGFYAR